MLTHQLGNCLLAVLCISLVECLPPKQVLDLAAQKWRENPDQDLINRYGADAYSRYVSIEPINEERTSMLKELFQAIFVPAKTTGSRGPHEIRGLLEDHWGYISRTDINYVFGVCGFLHNASEEDIEKLKNGEPIVTKIKAKMVSLKLYNRLFFNFTDEMNTRRIVELIKEHTGKDLPLSDAFVNKYGY